MKKVLSKKRNTYVGRVVDAYNEPNLAPWINIFCSLI